MDDDFGSEGGPRGTFESYKAEGELLYKLKQFRKAIDAYTTALDLNSNDKNCLIARSKCYLQLGESKSALKDAETSLEDDSTYHKGLYQKAEVLYSQGEFELALMFYHRGHKLRPELQEFTRGINKAQEAIDNSVGTPDRVKLTKEGDLSFFDKSEEEQKPKGYRAYQRVSAKQTTPVRKQRPKSQDKSIKQLLGELYKDKEYLEKLLEETDTTTAAGRGIYELVWDGLAYLDTRSEFWRQQKPLYARKRDKAVRNRAAGGLRGASPQDYIITELEKIDEVQSEGRYQESLKKSKQCLKFINSYDESTIRNKGEVVANLHSYMGNAYLEMGEYEKSLDYHQKDLEFANSNKNDDARSRSLDNLGRVYARMGKFQDAIDVWSEKVSLSKSPLESTWLYHEIGRCYLELDNYTEALSFGEKSVSAAEEAKDGMWLLNATVLVAQAQVKLKDYSSAHEMFLKALDMSKSQGDEAAEAAINKAITDVSNKMKQSEAEDQRKTDEKDTDEVNDTSHNKSDVKEDETPEQVKDAAETEKEPENTEASNVQEAEDTPPQEEDNE